MSRGEMPDIFSERLRTAREHRKLSQAELAEKADLQPSAISHFENGRRSPSFDNLKGLADALDVTTDYLIGRSDEMGVSSSVALRVFRNMKEMSAEDLDTYKQMGDMLAKKQAKKA
jgi:transcriptional regulator with XRE-family HTH domain